MFPGTSCVSICYHCLWFCLWLLLKAPSSLHPHFKYLCTLIRSSLIHAEQSHLSLPFLIGEVIHSLSPLRGPLLDSIQYVHISEEPRTGCSNPVQHLSSTKYRGRITSFSLPFNTWLNAARFVMGTSLVYALHGYPLGLPGPFLTNFFPARRPPHMQYFALLLVELHEISISPLLLPAQVPVDGSITFWCPSYSSQFSLQNSVLPHHPDL